MSFAKKLGSKVFDDILGIDPSGQGLVGSIRDNPRTAAVLGGLLIPGVGSALTSGLGAAGSAILAFSDGTNWKRSDTGGTISAS